MSAFVPFPGSILELFTYAMSPFVYLFSIYLYIFSKILYSFYKEKNMNGQQQSGAFDSLTGSA